MTEKNKRNSGIELLRIIAMFSIVFGHFLSHGGGFTLKDDVHNVYFLVEQFFDSVMSFKVNVFVLITGYYLIDKENLDVWRKIKSLWKNEIFYSLIIMIIFLILGNISKIEIIKSIFPTLMYRYWFVTLYIALITCAPILNRIFKNLDLKTYKRYLYVMIGLGCMWQTVMPFATTIDNNRGFSILWFFILYCTGGYLYRQKDELRYKKKKWACIFIGAVALEFIYSIACEYVVQRFNYPMDIPYHNSIFVLILSVSIFEIFLNMEIGKRVGSTINYLAGSVISVYLISDNPLIRDVLYTKIFHVNKYYDSIKSIGIILVYTIVVFSVCMLLDIVKRVLENKVLRFKDKR